MFADKCVLSFDNQEKSITNLHTFTTVRNLSYICRIISVEVKDAMKNMRLEKICSLDGIFKQSLGNRKSSLANPAIQCRIKEQEAC